jgi:hypothetical protein
MGQDEQNLGLSGVLSAAKQAPGRGLPPVHLWHPAHCGDIDIVIRRDGLWFHEGTPIGREALVRLFSTVLRKDPDGFHLVTPVEKLRITVEDAPFIATRVDRELDSQGRPSLRFLTNVGDSVVADAEHPIRVDSQGREQVPRPYVMVRHGLEALISRPVFYELADLAERREEPAGTVMAVQSAGVWFPIGGPEIGA